MRLFRRRDPQRPKQANFTYDVHGLDVWGNPEDGFEVNDVYPSSGTVTLREDMTDAQIVKALRREGFIGPRVRSSRVSIDAPEGVGSTIYVEDAKHGKPVYQLRVK
jgi:hypothetical protein